jgi:hypothetical protein
MLARCHLAMGTDDDISGTRRKSQRIEQRYTVITMCSSVAMNAAYRMQSASKRARW